MIFLSFMSHFLWSSDSSRIDFWPTGIKVNLSQFEGANTDSLFLTIHNHTLSQHYIAIKADNDFLEYIRLNQDPIPLNIKIKQYKKISLIPLSPPDQEIILYRSKK